MESAAPLVGSLSISLLLTFALQTPAAHLVGVSGTEARSRLRPDDGRGCSPTGGGRWKDVPEERMCWQQEVLILTATPCLLSPAARNLAGNPLPPAEEIHRKSAEEILCVSTGNPYKVSLANLPDLLRHHTEQIFQDSLSTA